MKLWEAMLEGAKAGPQLFRRQMDGRGGLCAWGAVGIGLDLGRPINIDDIEELWPEIMGKGKCPECGIRNVKGSFFTCGTWLDVIVHLNNDHRWSRQRIAEWLANRELKFKPIESKKEVPYAQDTAGNDGGVQVAHS